MMPMQQQQQQPPQLPLQMILGPYAPEMPVQQSNDGFIHPLNILGREQDAELTSRTEEFIAPPIRIEDLPRLYESMPADAATQMIFALQGIPGQKFPMGGQ